MTIPTHVVVGIILNADRQVLISYRHPGSHQGGLWEFPGGKLESGESAVEFIQSDVFRSKKSFTTIRKNQFC